MIRYNTTLKYQTVIRLNLQSLHLKKMNKYIYIRFLTTLQLTTFENIIILTKQFLRLPKCFQFCLGIKPSAGYVLYMGEV